jgi:hypothetical protein
VGGASGRVREHRGIASELVDVQAVPNGGQSRLSTWRPLVVAAQRGTDIDGAARRPMVSEDGSGRSPVLPRDPGGISRSVRGQSRLVVGGAHGGQGGGFSWRRCCMRC